MSKHYILNDVGEPVEADLMTWARWFESNPNRVVARDELPNGVTVSTVFLGLDHSFESAGLPVLWETMIFGGKHDGYMDRYTSQEAALQGHTFAVGLASPRPLTDEVVP